MRWARKTAVITGGRGGLGQELAPFGIRVNAVAPSLALTGPRIQKMWLERKSEPQPRQHLANIPLGRLAEVEEVTGVVRFLCLEEANCLVGLTLDINGGVYSP